MRNQDSPTTTANKARHAGIALSPAMMLVTLGVVYGDIGTSPMYVMKAIVNGNGGIASVTEELILGALSLVIWTITLVTTVKYVVVAHACRQPQRRRHLCSVQLGPARGSLAHPARHGGRRGALG